MTCGDKKIDIYASLKAVWKKLGINGGVKNFSSKKLWVVETDSAKPVARWLEPGFKTPKEIDVDGFRRVDNGSIEGHNSWWKIYDISNAEIYEKGDDLQASAVTKTAVDELHFGRDITYVSEGWGSPIQLALDVRRDKKRRIIAYQLSHVGWVDFDTALRMTCHHEIDNTRPIFPANGRPYIRTKKDQILNNNLSKKGIS